MRFFSCTFVFLFLAACANTTSGISVDDCQRVYDKITGYCGRDTLVPASVDPALTSYTWGYVATTVQSDCRQSWVPAAAQYPACAAQTRAALDCLLRIWDQAGVNACIHGVPSGCSNESDAIVACVRAQTAAVDVGTNVARDAGVVDATAQRCGTRCSAARTHWNPYAVTCQVNPSIDVGGNPVCGCDGVTYDSPGIAARRGVRDSMVGRCGDTLTPCNERSCTSAEFCDSTDCEPSRRTCRPRPTSCEPALDDQRSCGCDNVWYADDCHRRLAGVALRFDESACGL